MFRSSNSAPVSSVGQVQKGAVVGRFCRGCGGIYPLYHHWHRGKSLNGRDHVSPPCTHEGEHFDDGAAWWEDAVRVLG